MTTTEHKPVDHGPIPFPVSREGGAVHFPTSQSVKDKPPAEPNAEEEDKDERPADELSAEELRLMADTMPGDGPGDD